MKPSRSTKYLKDTTPFNSCNKYMMLLKRLDEDEGLSEPTIEEKLKLAEDYLRLSCVRFCEVTSNLFEDKVKHETDDSYIVESEVIEELFEAKSLKPSFRPPKSELKTLSTEKRKVCRLKTSVVELKDNNTATQKLQQAYYLPPSSWFSSPKPSMDLSSEEVELLSSCATKAFVKFLNEKKMEIPKIFHLYSQKYVTKEDS